MVNPSWANLRFVDRQRTAAAGKITSRLAQRPQKTRFRQELSVHIERDGLFFDAGLELRHDQIRFGPNTKFGEKLIELWRFDFWIKQNQESALFVPIVAEQRKISVAKVIFRTGQDHRCVVGRNSFQVSQDQRFEFDILAFEVLLESCQRLSRFRGSVRHVP